MMQNTVEKVHQNNIIVFFFVATVTNYSKMNKNLHLGKASA